MALIPKRLKASKHAKIGAGIGIRLADEVAQRMLERFHGLKVDPRDYQFGAALDDLKMALGSAADDEVVVRALQRLDNAHGHDSAARIDEAWHAAWQTAMGLITGATFSRMNSHHAKSVGSETRSD